MVQHLQWFIAFAMLVKVETLNVCNKHNVYKNVSRARKLVMETTACMTIGMLACFPNESIAATLDYPRMLRESESLVWQLPNGEVKLSDPLASFPQYKLSYPILLGSGGGGAVFKTTPLNGRKEDIALKISWVRSAGSVERECRILEELEYKNTRNVERCLGVESYPLDSRRVAVALEPVVDSSVASVGLVNKDVQIKSVQSIICTLVDMLGANIVTIDVQPLIDKETGSVLFIDMTEAQKISNPPSFLDLALASSFVAEMVSLIPESLTDVASKAFLAELRDAQESRGIYFPISIYEMLQSDDILSDSESADFIGKTLTSLRRSQE